MNRADVQTIGMSFKNTPEFETSNPRHKRALLALMRRPMTREHLDTAAGCANGPDLVADLRRRGLQVPCERVPDYDRDGLPVRRGVYRLTGADRRKVWRFFKGVGHA